MITSYQDLLAIEPAELQDAAHRDCYVTQNIDFVAWSNGRIPAFYHGLIGLLSGTPGPDWIAILIPERQVIHLRVAEVEIARQEDFLCQGA